jgi:hypothetical protein
MTNVNINIALTAALGLILGLAISPVRADVKVQSVTHFGGIAGMGASDISNTSYLQGIKKRVESNVKFTGAILGALQKWKHGDKGSSEVTIFRLDGNRKFLLNTENNTYREEPIYTPPRPTQEARSSASSRNSSGQKENDVRVVKNEFNVRDTGKTQNVNGFQTREYLVTWNLETENIKTHEHSRSLMTTELWNSEDARFISAHKEEATYNRAYAQLMHMPTTGDMAKQFGLTQVTFLRDKDMKPFLEKLSKIRGFPVVTDVKWEAGCISSCAENDQTAPKEQQSSGNSDALGGLLSNLLAKKSAQNPQSDQHSNSANGLATIFQSHTEVQTIDTGSQPSSLFDVPAGYTKN